MADVGGLPATRKLKEAHPSVAVIILTIYDAEIYVAEALRAGASGYLLKDSPQDVLISAIKRVVAGGTHFPEDLDPSDYEEPRLDELTEREVQVLGLIAKGWTNREIAEELHLAEVTIKKEVQTITRKLGVSDRTRAAVLGIQLGLIEP